MSNPPAASRLWSLEEARLRMQGEVKLWIVLRLTLQACLKRAVCMELYGEKPWWAKVGNAIPGKPRRGGFANGSELFFSACITNPQACFSNLAKICLALNNLPYLVANWVSNHFATKMAGSFWFMLPGLVADRISHHFTTKITGSIWFCLPGLVADWVSHHFATKLSWSLTDQPNRPDHQQYPHPGHGTVGFPEH